MKNEGKTKNEMTKIRSDESKKQNKNKKKEEKYEK